MPSSPPRSPERPRREGPASLVRRIVGSSARRGGVARPSKRVATTVTQTWSLISSSMLAPKMMLASGWAASPTTLAASETSTSERSAPPVIESRIERAPSIEVSSSGEEIAFSAASIARPSPWAMPIPSSARPASDMIERTSAKSRLITAGSVTRSEIPCTPWRSTSSATLKASIIEVCWSSTSSRRSLGTTISVSTSAESSSMPFCAWVPRRLPSKLNGLVTMPAVIGPTSRGRGAETGEARPPVPPPPGAPTLAARGEVGGGGLWPGAPAGAGGDEDHVRALQQALDLVLLLEGRAVPHLRVGTGAEATRLLLADVDGDVSDAELQGLQIGVDSHELDPRHAGVDHPVDRVDAGAADAHHLDHRLVGLAAPRRLVGRLLAPIARVFRRELLPPRRRLLVENPFQPLRSRLI